MGKKFLIFWIGLILFSCWGLGFSADSVEDNNVQGKYRLALEAMNQQDWITARNYFKEVLKINPDHEGAIQGLAKIHQLLRSHMFEESEELVLSQTQTISKDEENETQEQQRQENKKKLRRQVLLEAQKRAEESEADRQQEWLRHIEGLQREASRAFSAKHYRRATELYEVILALDPESGVAYKGIARVRTAWASERTQMMKEQLETLHSELIEDLYNKASQLYSQEAYAQALDVLLVLLHKDPRHKPALKLMKQCRSEIERVQQQEMQNRLLQQMNPSFLLAPLSGQNPGNPSNSPSSQGGVGGSQPTPPQPPEAKDDSRRPTLESPSVKVLDIKKQFTIPVTTDFRDADLLEVLDYLSGKIELNIIPSQSVVESKKLVTLQVDKMSVEEILKYLLRNENLTYRIEGNAIRILTLEEAQDEPVETRVYRWSQGIGVFTQFSGDGSASGSALGTLGSSTETKNIKDVLEEAVDFPKDSKLVLDERTGTLIISNTPTNFQTIEKILKQLDVAPAQVQIEARFVELGVTDLNELGLEFSLNSDYPLNKKGGEFFHGVKSGAEVDFANFSRQTEGLNLTLEGILSKPQFQILLHAIEERQDAKTLSAPKVTTLNNQTAVIKVVDEFVYPSRYEASVVRKDLNGDGDFLDEVSGTKETQFINTPQDFVTRDVGIILRVTPNIGSDGKTINLILLPEVSGQVGTFTYSGQVSLPKFSSRNLNTSVVIEDGETVILGGLMKETDTKKVTKVPFLGDIPLLGSVFKRQARDTERQNLVIFVTASLLEEGKA